jgi:hypothetical protein
MQLAVVVVERRLLHRDAKAFGHRRGLRGARARQDDRELLAADASGNVGGPHHPPMMIATSRSVSSPVAWPHVSLIFLKWSMSRLITASGSL